MGTGCDTILAQMAAECLDCDVDHIVVFGADTDISPYDSGSYASSTTYVTGKAVEQACEKLKIIYVILLYKHSIVKKKMLNSPHKVLKI